MLVTVILGLLLAAYGVWVGFRLWKRRGQCSCGCEGCAMSCSCHEKKG